MVLGATISKARQIAVSLLTTIPLANFDHLVFYRPGRGATFIIKQSGAEIFTPVYAQGDGGNGIGGYDLRSAADRVFAFDYNRSGKQDHLCLYRPSTGTM
jgi:hypothetical protein